MVCNQSIADADAGFPITAINADNPR